MKTWFISLSLIFSTLLPGISQEVKLTVELSSDTILLGNYLRVKFTLENANGQFEAPIFDGFRVISGPNMSSSFNFISGKMSQKISYEYFLDPEDIGQYYLGEAYFVSDTETYASEPIEIWVLPNPDGIKQDSEIKLLDEYFFNEEPKEEPKKKIKAKRHKI